MARIGGATSGVTTETSRFQENDVELADGDIYYIGGEDINGFWWIKRIDDSGSPIPIQHATIKNNPTVTSYTDAWTNRATLTYGDYAGVV